MATMWKDPTGNIMWIYTDEEHAKIERVMQEKHQSNNKTWSLRQAYQSIGTSYQFMNSLLHSERAVKLLDGAIERPTENSQYVVFPEVFNRVWNEHKEELLKIGKEKRRVLYPS